MKLLVICSRGSFLVDYPSLPEKNSQGGLMCNLSMPWFENRSFSSLATHLAHLVELKLWREFICAQTDLKLAGIPQPRYLMGPHADAKTKGKNKGRPFFFSLNNLVVVIPLQIV